MTDDLPGLVARLREKRPDLEGLPEIHYEHGWWCDGAYNDFRLLNSTARVIVIGACAEALARSGWGMAYDNDVWAARANVSPVKIGLMPESPDFTTAIVEAVIALAEKGSNDGQ